MPDGPDPVDWLGATIDCGTCRFRARQTSGQCGPGWACVQDRYARRIERFFLLNPDLADDCLTLPYFEARAQAARAATLFRLPPLLEDPDPGVRAVAILRLPARHALRRLHDPDRTVRIAVAHRLAPDDLLPLLSDEDPYVRLIAVRRIDPGALPVMLRDPDPEIRALVAARIAPGWLVHCVTDPEPMVRRAAVLRLPGKRLHVLARDSDIRVRHAVAERAPADLARAMQADPDPQIRDTAAERLAALALMKDEDDADR
ncbi:4Fe4S-binding leucine-rich repeat protein [Paracoccaceae bacterium Fryx2]|nr:4Fe4S-binding leucine-rich repeat protein [Paracoccaceae bacterium Fryx2]